VVFESALGAQPPHGQGERAKEGTPKERRTAKKARRPLAKETGGAKGHCAAWASYTSEKDIENRPRSAPLENPQTGPSRTA